MREEQKNRLRSALQQHLGAGGPPAAGNAEFHHLSQALAALADADVADCVSVAVELRRTGEAYYSAVLLEQAARLKWSLLADDAKFAVIDCAAQVGVPYITDNVTMQKNAGFVAAVAARVWPQQLSNLFPRLVELAETGEPRLIHFALQTVHLLKDYACEDFRSLSNSRRRELQKHLETEWPAVLVLLRLAKDSFTGQQHRYALIESVAAATSLFPASKLLEVQVDQLALFFATSVDDREARALKGAVLSLFHTMVTAIGRKKTKIDQKDFERFIRLLSAQNTEDAAVLSLMKDLVDKCVDYILALSPGEFSAFWEAAVMRPLARAAPGVAAVAATIGHVLLAKKGSQIIGIIRSAPFFAALLVRAFRVGEPAVLELADPAALTLTDSVVVLLAERGGLDSAGFADWSRAVGRAADEADERDSFASQAANLKTAIGNCVSVAWLYEEANFPGLWCEALNAVVNSPAWNSPRFWDSSSNHRATTERLRSFTTPAFVTLDAFLTLLEAVGQKVRSAVVNGSLKVEVPPCANQHVAAALLGLNFPPTRSTYLLENRRLDAISSCVHFFLAASVPSEALLRFVLSRSLLECGDEQSQQSRAVFRSGCVETLQDQCYVIRRRGLYCLMAFCEKGAGSAVLEVLPALTARFQSEQTLDMERSLLREAIAAVVGCSGSFAEQEQATEVLCRDAVLALRGVPGDRMVDFLLGTEGTCASGGDAEIKAEARRLIARNLAHIEGVFRRTQLPDSSSPADGCVEELLWLDGQRLLVKWPSRNPLAKAAREILPILLELTVNFQNCWSRDEQQRRPWVAQFLTPGDEELVTYGGDLLLGAERAATLFPASAGLMADQVMLTKRHLFNLRSSFYRTLGTLTKAGPGFYASPLLASGIVQFARQSLETVALPHLALQVNLFWATVVADCSALAEVEAFPVLELLSRVIVPFFGSVLTRVELELRQLQVIRESLTNPKDLQIYTLSVGNSKSCAAAVSDCLCHMLTAAANQSGPDQQPAGEEALLGKFREALYSDSALMRDILGAFSRLGRLPFPSIIADAAQIQCRLARQLSKNVLVVLPPNSATSLCAGIFLAAVDALTDRTLYSFDPGSLTSTAGATSLERFLVGDGSSELPEYSVVYANLLYEALRAMVRVHNRRCNTAVVNATAETKDTKNMLFLTPDLHDAIEVLRRSVGQEELEPFLSDLVKTKEAHDSGACKSVLRSIVERLRSTEPSGEAKIEFKKANGAKKDAQQGSIFDPRCNASWSLLSTLFAGDS